MQGMKSLTKQDLLDLIDENFKDENKYDPIATFFYCSDGSGKQQQCILFRKEIYNP